MSPTARAACRIPAAIRRSRLMRMGGCAVVDGLLDAVLFERLLTEAVARYEEAIESQARTSDDEPWRGGSPARRFLSANGGPVQDSILQAPGFSGALAELCGITVRPSGGRGTFTYYARPGDHLAIHRDVEQCDLAVITCLHETHPTLPAGKLAIYRRRTAEPLQAIRATPEDGCRPLPLPPGQTALLFGGIVPHQILPLAQGQLRVVSILCFEVVI